MLVQVILNRFPAAIYTMKSLNLVKTLAIAAALLVGATGCKHTPKNVTNIPRTNLTPIRDDTGGIPRLAGPTNPNGPGNAGRLNDGSGLTDKNLANGTDLTGANAKPPTDLNSAAAQTQNRPPDSSEDRTTFAEDAVHFDYDRSSVKTSEVPHVQRVAAYLKNEPTKFLRVEGNCDERGTEEYNRSLGERRALAVRELLIASGIAPERISTVTFGEDKPVDNGHDESAWAKNRRADFVVLTPTGNAPLQ
jgi:peptidoglycan-associated lipoprotein